jgi:hypothetical protein
MQVLHVLKLMLMLLLAMLPISERWHQVSKWLNAQVSLIPSVEINPSFPSLLTFVLTLQH